MRLEVRHENDILIVTVINPRIDERAADDFKNQMFQLISEGNLKIILNIAEVNFIDSSGLGVIVASLKQLKGEGKFVICTMNDSVERMFKLTRMNKIFSLFDTENEALEYMSKPIDE